MSWFYAVRKAQHASHTLDPHRTPQMLVIVTCWTKVRIRRIRYHIQVQSGKYTQRTRAPYRIMVAAFALTGLQSTSHSRPNGLEPPGPPTRPSPGGKRNMASSRSQPRAEDTGPLRSVLVLLNLGSYAVASCIISQRAHKVGRSCQKEGFAGAGPWGSYHGGTSSTSVALKREGETEGGKIRRKKKKKKKERKGKLWVSSSTAHSIELDRQTDRQTDNPGHPVFQFMRRELMAFLSGRPVRLQPGSSFACHRSAYVGRHKPQSIFLAA
jgi:hypothetical protein